MFVIFLNNLFKKLVIKPQFTYSVVSYCCAVTSTVSYIYTCIHSFLDSFPYRPLQSIEESSLCDTVGPY